jgi:dephospho-CoA kinase
MRKKLVLISGKKYSGKDTFAEFFKEKNFYKMALADSLKEQLYIFSKNIASFEISIEDFYSNKSRELGINTTTHQPITIRSLMQWFGQSIKILMGQYYWVNLLENEIKENSCLSNSNIVVTDCRFLYELSELIKRFSDRDVYTIRIVRDSKEVDSDISEIDLDLVSDSYFDFVINNSGSIQDLKNQFDALYAYLQ